MHAGTRESSILVSISSIVLEQLDIGKQEPHHEILAEEIVTLLEALSSTAESELVENYWSFLLLSKDAKLSILAFFALLSNSQPDVHAHLLTTTTVIPTLVIFLAQLTAAFWEDDEDLLSASSEEVSMAIHTLNQTLFLLHHFVFTSTSFINLRQKLHAPYHRIFNGLMHMFIVTFGRLSYGEAPEWIDRQGRIDLVSSTDMARDILDHVVDGPEADRTWQAYQLEGDTLDDMDEESMEEQLLGERI
ncbi:hypothetical protein H0H92_014466 [Tricholoma furcatifolium]|nr:hypothetical protein H0H92_014466 [Tricholoma furcatifolium]